MTRRLFASLLTVATADPDRLLWTPGKTTISIPAPRVATYEDLRQAEMYWQMVKQGFGHYSPYIPMAVDRGWYVRQSSHLPLWRHGSFEGASLPALQRYAPYVRDAHRWAAAVGLERREGRLLIRATPRAGGIR